jgi:hypothetical protein
MYVHVDIYYWNDNDTIIIKYYSDFGFVYLTFTSVNITMIHTIPDEINKF